MYLTLWNCTLEDGKFMLCVIYYNLKKKSCRVIKKGHWSHDSLGKEYVQVHLDSNKAVEKENTKRFAVV